MAVALRDLERGRRQRRPVLRVVHPQPPAPPTRRAVYWRRRLVVLAVVLAVTLGSVMIAGAVVSSTAMSPARVEMTVVVSAGETLWDIARRYAPATADRSAWVADVAASNDVDPAAVQPGTPIVVPVEMQRVVANPRVP